jgi:GNAT superfamily N-acetyltransferase
MPEATIRQGRAADIPRLMEIRAAVAENRLSDPDLIRAGDYRPFIDAGRLWAWEEAGSVLGFAALDAPGASLWALFVEPGGAGRGIGKALLRRAVDEARAAGLAELHLVTAPDSRAERLYRSLGWTDTGHDPGGDLHMVLKL